MDIIRRRIRLGSDRMWVTEEGYLIGYFGVCRVPGARTWWVIHQGTGYAIDALPSHRDACKFARALQTIPGDPWNSKSVRQITKNATLKQAVDDLRRAGSSLWQHAPIP